MLPIRIALVSMHLAAGPEAVPLGAACVAAAVKSVFSAQQVTIILVESLVGEDPRMLADRILATDADAVGFSIYSWNRRPLLAVARRVAGLRPETVLFCGGPDPTAQPEGLSRAGGGTFHFVVLGEGEGAVIDIIKTALGTELEADSDDGFAKLSPALRVRGTELIVGRPEDPAKYPSPWLDGTLSAENRPGVLWELARGCPYRCAYCFESKGQHRVRYFPEDRLRQELRAFVAARVPSVFVLDPTFNVDKARTLRILELLQKEAPDIHWHFEVRAENVDPGQARLFAALGASLQIGLQTSDPKVAAGVDRSFDKSRFSAKIDLLNQAGAVFGLDLIYGLPGDTLSGYRASLDYALSLYPNTVDLFRLAVLPGTVLFDRSEQQGLQADQDAPYLLRAGPGFPAADLAAAERLSRAVDLFYNRGRAVAWFNQVLHPLGLRPSTFFDGFADFLDRRVVWETVNTAHDPVALERLQLAYLDQRLEKTKLDYLLPAIWDIVRFNGAWARALAEGISTDIDFSYDPELVTGPAAQDLREFATLAEFSPHRVRVKPGAGEPRVSIL